MATIDFWIISIAVQEMKSSLAIQQMREELFLSPNVKLCGMNKMAHIESEELANKFLSGCKFALDNRYKYGYEALVKKSGGSNHKLLVNQIERDSFVIKERLRTGNFSPNKSLKDAP